MVLGVFFGGEENMLLFLKVKEVVYLELMFEILLRYDEVVLFE